MNKLDMFVTTKFALLNSYIKQNIFLIVFSLFCGVEAFGYELFNFTLSIDEELKSFTNVVPAWIGQGRWGTYFLLKFFMPESLIPFLPILIAIIFLVITSLVVVHTLGDDNIVKAIFCAIFITFPSNAFFMEFNTYNFAVAFGMAVTATAGALMHTYLRCLNRQILFSSVLLLTIALSVYQGVIGVWLSLIALYALRSSTSDSGSNWPSPTRLYVGGGAILCLGMIFYKLTDYGMKWLYHIPPDQYLDKFNGWKQSGASEALLNVIQNMGRHVIGRAFYGEKTIVFAWFLLLIFIVIVFSSRKVRSIGMPILSCLVLVVSPFAMSLALGAPNPIRSMVGLPVMIGGVWYAVAQISGSGIRAVVFAAALAIAYTNSFSITRLFYSDHLTYQADRDLASRVMDRVSLLDVKFDQKDPLTVAFVGSRPPPKNEAYIQDEVFGASFFDFGGPNQFRIHSFLKTLGVEGIRPPTDEQFMTALAYSSGLEDWPHSKSVVYLKDMVIVKLSKPTEKQVKGTVH